MRPGSKSSSLGSSPRHTRLSVPRNLALPVILLCLSKAALSANADTHKREDALAPDRMVREELFFGSVETAIGLYIGSGHYHGTKFRNSPIGDQYSTSGVMVELTGKHYGLLIDSTHQSSEDTSDSIHQLPYQISFNSQISTAAISRRFVLQPNKSSLVLRLGASHAQRVFTLKDDYLEKIEDSVSNGPYLGLSLFVMFGERLSGDMGGSVRKLPVKIDLLGIKDTGVQSEWTVGLTVRF